MAGAGGEGGAAANPWLVNEPEETRGLGFSAIKQQQQRIVEGKVTQSSDISVWCGTVS